MDVIIVGCGRVGSELARTLFDAGHGVTVVDKDPAAFRRLPDGFERTVTGVGFDRDTLVEAGVERADAFAAVTSGDNSNVLSVRVAREVFGVPTVVARIYDPRRAEIYQRLGIETVASVTWTTTQVLRRLTNAAAQADWVHPSGSLCLVERPIPTTWIGHRLDELEPADGVRLVALTRAGRARVASPNLVVQEGDLVHAAVTEDTTETFDKVLAAGPGGHA